MAATETRGRIPEPRHRLLGDVAPAQAIVFRHVRVSGWRVSAHQREFARGGNQRVRAEGCGELARALRVDLETVGAETRGPCLASAPHHERQHLSHLETLHGRLGASFRERQGEYLSDTAGKT